MARRYQPDELLRLSASPLAVKPDTLPPAEEWMGPIPDPTAQKKNTHARENSNQEIGNRRPSVFENRHTSRGSEDIVLGPPKTSFASASAARILGKSIDLNDKSSTSNDPDDKNERYNFRDKFFKDRDLGDKDPDKRDNRLGTGTARRGGRDDREDWGAGRQRRTFGSDELDRKPRRNGESDRWDIRDHKDNRDQRDQRDNRDHRDQQDDRGVRDKETGRFLPRRDIQGRGRHEQSWFRDDAANNDAPDAEDERRAVRNREWRQNRGTHGHDREWNRGAKFEQDPEWMDSTDQNETKQAHTQEDFQRWKERMKAGSGQAPVEEKKERVAESGNGDFWHQPETKRADGELFSNLDAPFEMNSGLDKFFGLWGENKGEQDASSQNTADLEVKKDPAPAKVQKPSRFAGIFSPPAEPVNQPPPEPPVTAKPPPAERPASADADQEGFQRILQMLGGNKSSRNTTPQADFSMQPRPPPQPQAEQPKPPPMLHSPPRETMTRQEYMPLQDTSPRNRGSGYFETATGPKPPKEASVHNRDSDFLLQLMQQSKISPPVNPHQANSHPSTAGHTPGVLNVPDLLSRPQGVQQQKTPTFLDDPAIANMQRPESNEPRDQGRRRGNGPSMGYFDEVSMSAAQSNQIASEANKVRLHPGQQPPMELRRPPGFEQMPPPGWPSHQLPPPQQQQPGPNPLAPPPGIPNPPRNMNPSFPPGPMPMHGGMPPPQNERQILTRGISGGGGNVGMPTGSSAGFGPPPGMGAPPGYMNMNAPPPPPPAFSPMGNTPDAMPRMPYGNQMYFGGGGGPPGPPPPAQQSRHPLDMYGGGGNDGNVGGRLGMMGSGPYR